MGPEIFFNSPYLYIILSMEKKWNDGVLGLFCAHCLG